MKIYEKEPIEPDEHLELAKAKLGSAYVPFDPPSITREEACEILKSQQTLLRDRKRGSLRDVGEWIEEGRLSTQVALCSSAVGLVISRSELRRWQTTLPKAGDLFEPRLGQYGIWRNLRCDDFLYLETGFSKAIGTCCLTSSYQVLTARHVFDVSAQAELRKDELVVLFDFGTFVDSRPRHVFSEHQSVFGVVDVETGKGDGPEDDWATFTLDRSPTLASGRLPVRRSNKALTPSTAVFTLGHPKGLPMRYAFADENSELSQCPPVHRAYLDGYVSASGSPVFRADDCTLTGVVTDACSEKHMYGRLCVEGDKYVSPVCSPQIGCQGALFIGLP